MNLSVWSISRHSFAYMCPGTCVKALMVESCRLCMMNVELSPKASPPTLVHSIQPLLTCVISSSISNRCRFAGVEDRKAWVCTKRELGGVIPTSRHIWSIGQMSKFPYLVHLSVATFHCIFETIIDDILV